MNLTGKITKKRKKLNYAIWILGSESNDSKIKIIPINYDDPPHMENIHYSPKSEISIIYLIN